MTATKIPDPDAPCVAFWGAARAVTGSMHLLEACGQRILLDCGTSRIGRDDSRPGAVKFPFDPETIDAVVLTHAHTDHCGSLPALVRQGYSGPIWCTAPTRDLSAIMLGDLAKVLDDRPVFPSTPTLGDVERVVRLCEVVEFDRDQWIGRDITLRFLDAGHLLGSAMAHVTIGGARPATVTYTGDIGRGDLPLHGPPAPVPPADLLICESTYGGRSHDTLERTTELLVEIVRRTIARDGKVLIPAFSLGRSQLVLHVLQMAIAAGRIPRVPIFLDSPLAERIVDVYRKYRKRLRLDETPSRNEFLGGPDVSFVGSSDESHELVSRPGPHVVIASSGMCDGGRIVQHLAGGIDDPRTSVVLVSYQAPGTLGHLLLERGPTVRFFNRTWNKWAEVYQLDGFSGHADHRQLRRTLAPIASRVGSVRLVHGEPSAAETLAAELRTAGFADVSVPERGDVWTSLRNQPA